MYDVECCYTCMYTMFWVGGVNAELGDEGLTHYVVADSVDPGDIPLTSPR